MRKLVSLVLTTVASTLASGTTLRELDAGPPPRECIYKTVGPTSLKFYYFLPTVAASPAPAVVWIHGGAWVGGTLDVFMPHARYVASRGAVGVNVEYRLVKPDGPSIGDCIADCKSAIRYLRAHADELGIDPKLIAVAGDSAGGHLAAALGCIDGFDDPSDNLALSARPNALILFNPVLDLSADDWIRYAVGGVALRNKNSPRPASAEEVARARAFSPVFHVRPGQPHTLLMHGRKDVIVPLAQSEQFAAAMHAVGNRCDFITVEQAGHAFALAFYKSPEPVVISVLRSVDRFLVSLGYFTGAPTLTSSAPPLWEPEPLPATLTEKSRPVR